MKRKLLIISLILAVFGALFYFLEWDEPLLALIAHLRTPGFTSAMHIVAFLGTVKFLLPLNILMIILEAKRDKWKSLQIPLGTLATWVLNSLIKNIIRRERPAISPLAKESSLSFPSGHAMVNSFFIMSLAIRYYRKRQKSFVFVLASLYILLMCFNRLYLGVHYPSDVLIGSSLGLFLSAIFMLREVGETPQKYDASTNPSDDSPADSLS